MIYDSKIFNSTQEFMKYIERKTEIKAKIYKHIYRINSVFALFFSFFSTIMGTVKLAASKLSEFSGFANLFVRLDDSGKAVDQWPVFTLWIGIAIAIINGLLALFVIRKKWIRNQKVNNLIQLEKIFYTNGEGKYNNEETKDIILFEKVSEILDIKYSRKDIK
ncbi:DUF4231 domain-containing protein [Mesomycoplasma lagogenitalium]|uniref:DUF4231 domain-containing protein n=1 Tax=Mesomycoplasma lagogenitalium TaxID=171286 RepID=A0ABY8LTV4_9BACT|nr:DUF4231 domain-containing protein [Mesomycoplasma lagogenitalium]WGI36670.1 DUF4231 domain-containing protein [Mesomycoplasma lagogenitalium]